MAWSTITGAGTSIATKFFGDVMNKINNMFNGVDISDVVVINPNVTWTFKGNAFRIEDSDATNRYIFVGGNLAADRNVNLPVLAAADTIDFIGTASTHTGAKTFDDTKFFLRNVADTFSASFVNTITADRIYTLPDAAGTVVITGLANQIADTEITAHTTSKITTLSKSLLNTSIVYTDQANILGDFLMTFKDNQLKINSPDDADGVTFVNSNQTANRNLIIPILLGADTLATIGVANAWGTLNQNIAATGKWREAGVNISPIGTHEQSVPASGLWASTTAGATGLQSLELGTNDVDLRFFDFTSTAADEHVQFVWSLPTEWDAGTVRAKFKWSHTSGTGNVVWGIQARAMSNSDPLDAAWGTIQEVTDANEVNDDIIISDFTPAMTIGNTPAKGDYIQWRLLRSGSDVLDTFTATARLHEVIIEYTIDAATST